MIILLYRLVVNLRSVYVGFVMNRVALEEVFLQVL